MQLANIELWLEHTGESIHANGSLHEIYRVCIILANLLGGGIKNNLNKYTIIDKWRYYGRPLSNCSVKWKSKWNKNSTDNYYEKF